MLRRLFTIVSALSLLLLLATCVLWVRSYGHPTNGEDQASVVWRGSRHTLRSSGGALTWFRPPTEAFDARPRYGSRSLDAVRELQGKPADFERWRATRPQPSATLAGRAP